jgi:hypothetical protein
MLAGAVILTGYGLMLNLAPLAGGRLVGAYVGRKARARKNAR